MLNLCTADAINLKQVRCGLKQNMVCVRNPIMYRMSPHQTT